MAMMGLLFAIIYYEHAVHSHSGPLNPKEFPNPLTLKRNTGSHSDICKLVIMITTIMAVVFLYLRQKSVVQWESRFLADNCDLKQGFQFLNEDIIGMFDKGDAKYAKVVTQPFIIEVLILLVIPTPFYDQYFTVECNGGQQIVYLLSDFAIAFMWLRLFFLYRSIYNYSIFSDAFAKQVYNSYGLKETLGFQLSCHLSELPNKTVMVLFLSTVLASAYLVRIFEIPYSRTIGEDTFDEYFNAVWFTVITLTTIGYGDISPSTKPGKAIVIALGFWGALLLSLLVVVMNSIFSLNNKHKMAMHHIKQTRQAA